MDEKKKFEIEYEDDFDAWLKQHDDSVAQEKKAAEEAQRAQQAEKAAVPPQPAAQPSPIVQNSNGDVPISRREQPNRAAAQQSRPAARQNDISSNGDIPISRREVVKNFQLHIDEKALNEPVVPQPVKRDKSVYFANRQPTKAELEARRAQERALQARKKQEREQLIAQRKKERKQISRLRKLLVLTIIVLCSIVTSAYTISCMNDIFALNRGKEIVTVTVEKGSDYKAIIGVLNDSGLVKHKLFCKLFTKFRNFDKKTYLNGIYYLTPNMGVEGMLNSMRENQTSDKTIRLYFPEGWTIQQIVKKLDENKVCPAEYIYAALREVDFDYSFVNEIPKDSGRYFSLEGYMFPDTYDFFVSDKDSGIGENPNSIVRKLLSNFESKWTEIYDKRAKELGLTKDEVIIIASIIQKEAADKEQMSKVSSVIHNRLNNSASYPTLGCDSTKNYINTYLSAVIGSGSATAYLPYYDTSGTRAGLPAGPICNPGTDAIEAALNPDDTKYYYFCHNEKGKIYLAKTYDEFQSNWAQVLKDNEAAK